MPCVSCAMEEACTSGVCAWQIVMWESRRLQRIHRPGACRGPRNLMALCGRGAGRGPWRDGSHSDPCELYHVWVLWWILSNTHWKAVKRPSEDQVWIWRSRLWWTHRERKRSVWQSRTREKPALLPFPSRVPFPDVRARAHTHIHSYRSQILISPSNLCPIKDKEQLRRLRRVEKCKEKKVAKLFLRTSHGSVGNQHHSGWKGSARQGVVYV